MELSREASRSVLGNGSRCFRLWLDTCFYHALQMRYNSYNPSKKENSETFCLSRFPNFSARCLADSNRRRRFCRPLTKPLIQGTNLECGCKGSNIIRHCQIFFLFFVPTILFFPFGSLSDVFQCTASTPVTRVIGSTEGLVDAPRRIAHSPTYNHVKRNHL